MKHNTVIFPVGRESNEDQLTVGICDGNHHRCMLLRLSHNFHEHRCNSAMEGCPLLEHTLQLMIREYSAQTSQNYSIRGQVLLHSKLRDCKVY